MFLAIMPCQCLTAVDIERPEYVSDEIVGHWVSADEEETIKINDYNMAKFENVNGEYAMG